MDKQKGSAEMEIMSLGLFLGFSATVLVGGLGLQCSPIRPIILDWAQLFRLSCLLRKNKKKKRNLILILQSNPKAVFASKEIAGGRRIWRISGVFLKRKVLHSFCNLCVKHHFGKPVAIISAQQPEKKK